MQGREFYEQVESHPDIEWLGVREGLGPREADEVLVCHRGTGVKHAVAVSSVLEHRWEDLEAVLTGRREACLMTHLTRIVGYYSRVRNWNRSKLAELRDRHAGTYAIPEKTPGKTAAEPVARERELAAVA